MSLKHENKKNDTELSKYLWQLKEKKKDFTITQKILAKARAYTNLPSGAIYAFQRNFLLYLNHTWQPQTSTMSSYRPADTGENTFLSTIISQTSSGHLRASTYNF